MTIMRLLLFTAILSSLVSPSLSLECEEPCVYYRHEQGGLHICSTTDYAEIRNTTSGECLVSLKANLKTVSHFDQFYTFGVTPVVRRNIGSDCWDSTPENVAKSIIADTYNFNAESMCRTNPDNSPSMEKEMEYFMDVSGYSDCASVVILHQEILGDCVKNLKTLRGFASVMYIITVIIGIILVFCLCLLTYLLVEKARSIRYTPPIMPSPCDSPSTPVAYPVLSSDSISSSPDRKVV